MANFWQGEFPWQNTGAKGWRGTSPVGLFPRQRFRALRRQQGMSGSGRADYYSTSWIWAPRRPRAPAVSRRLNPRVETAEASYDFGRPGGEHPTSRHQGRLASLCAELLSALPPSRSPSRGDRHIHKPHRLPLHRSRRQLEQRLNAALRRTSSGHVGRLGVHAIRVRPQLCTVATHPAVVAVLHIP